MGNEAKALVDDCIRKLHTLCLQLGHCLLDIIAVERNISHAGGLTMVAILGGCRMHAHISFR